MPARRTVVGVDLGGTYIAAARVSEEGEVEAKTSVEARVADGGEKVIERMISAAASVLDETVKAVGVCSPGVIDPVNSVSLSDAVNIPGWDGMEIGRRFREALHLPCFADNDANAAVAAEAWMGAGRGESVVLILTLGTGIGGGAVIDGRVYHGKSNLVAEFGHITVELNGRRCNCGNRGCIEAYASAGAVGRAAREALRDDPSSAMLNAAGGDVEKVDAKLVCDAAREGDKLACKILDHACARLAAGIGNLINAFNPGVVILSGGMSLAGEVLLSRVRRELKNGRAYPPILADCRVVAGSLGNSAGMLGAAKIAWDGLDAVLK